MLDKADGDVASSADIEGNPRFDLHDPGGGVGNPPYVDMGAYEFNPP